MFDSVAERYDLMNDLMSLGLHRAWKAFALAIARPRPGERVLDVATGSGDLALALCRRTQPGGEVWISDINRRMLDRGRDRLLDAGLTVPAVQCDAERLPFAARTFDCVTVGFGLRNMTRKDAALAEMARVLKPGGRLVVLEFSKVWKPLEGAYDWYSFKVLPWLGDKVAGDAAAYRYLAESIRMHPDQATLAAMMRDAGLSQVEVFNLAAGVVAVHRGVPHLIVRLPVRRYLDMGKWLLLTGILALSGALVATDADARRLGGGRNIGAQRNVTAPPAQTPAKPAQQAAPAQQGTQPAAAPAATGSRWMPILGGLALGGMLGYLFGGNGLMGDPAHRRLAIAGGHGSARVRASATGRGSHATGAVRRHARVGERCRRQHRAGGRDQRRRRFPPASMPPASCVPRR